MSNQKASSALLARIAEAALKEFGQENLYVAQAPAGMALSDAHLDLLEQLEMDRLKDLVSVARLVEISQIVDCIQDLSGVLKTPAQNPGYLSDLFPQVVNNVEFLAAPLSSDDQRQYEQAKSILFEEPPFLKTPAYQEFCVLRSELEKKDVMLAEMQRNLRHLETSEEKSVLESEFADIKHICAEQKEVLEALDRAHGFRMAESIVDNAERRIDALPQSVRTALDTMELFQITNPADNITHIACSFFPSHLSEDNWTPLKLTREDISARANGGQNSADDSNEIDDNDIESIELETQTVVCERPWLWSALFENHRWNWRSPSPLISTGKLDPGDRGLIPAYIHGLIFARNLTIKCKNSAQPQLLQLAAPPKPTASFLMHALRPAAVNLKQGFTVAASSRASVSPTLSTMALARPGAVVAARPAGMAAVPRLNAIIRRPIPVAVASAAKIKGRIPAAQLVFRPGALYKFTIKGRVSDERGQGIYKAMVSLRTRVGSRRTYTGKDGTFTFASITLGRYAVNIAKTGFIPTGGAMTAPQTAPLNIRMRQSTVCLLLVRLLEQVGQGTRPFAGTAKVLIQTGNDRRIENMDGRSESLFSLPPGNIAVTVTSSEADRISPSNARITLSAGGERRTLIFNIFRAVTIANPDTQVLGFVCLRIPRSPEPEPVV